MIKKTFKFESKGKTLKIHEQDLTNKMYVESTAEFVMDGLLGRVSPELLDLMNTMLLGFNDDMQLEIADDLFDFVTRQEIHTTGCLSADAVLAACYKCIADEKGFDLTITF